MPAVLNDIPFNHDGTQCKSAFPQDTGLCLVNAESETTSTAYNPELAVSLKLSSTFNPKSQSSNHGVSVVLESRFL